MNSVGFKKQHADLADVSPTDSGFGLSTEPWLSCWAGAADGGGAVIIGLLTDLKPGLANVTDQPLDLMIDGDGFIPVTAANGPLEFTRNGALHLDASRRLSIGNDQPLARRSWFPRTPLPYLSPPTERSPGICPQGVAEVLGRIQLTRFTNPEDLERKRDGLLSAGVAARQSTSGFPGEDGLGRSRPRTLESCNVDLGEEMVRVIQAQRGSQ